jgi:hypothetical protein
VLQQSLSFSMPRRSVATLVLTALHVAAFAELGVLTRVYLDKLFQVTSSLSFVPRTLAF